MSDVNESLVSDGEAPAPDVELKAILGQTLLIGHRGGNSPWPDERQEARRREDEVGRLIDRANELTLLVKCSELGLDSDSYDPNPVHVIDNSPSLSTPDYHPGDLIAPRYVKGINRITHHGRFIFRLKDAVPCPRESLWSEDMKWVAIARGFSRFPREILDPLAYLLNTIRVQRQLGRNVDEYVGAINEIVEIYQEFGWNIPLEIETMKTQSDARDAQK